MVAVLNLQVEEEKQEKEENEENFDNTKLVDKFY